MPLQDELQLSKAVVQLIHDDVLRDRKCERGKNYIKEHADRETIMPRFEEMYEEFSL